VTERVRVDVVALLVMVALPWLGLVTSTQALAGLAKVIAFVDLNKVAILLISHQPQGANENAQAEAVARFTIVFRCDSKGGNRCTTYIKEGQSGGSRMIRTCMGIVLLSAAWGLAAEPVAAKQQIRSQWTKAQRLAAQLKNTPVQRNKRLHNKARRQIGRARFRARVRDRLRPAGRYITQPLKNAVGGAGFANLLIPGTMPLGLVAALPFLDKSAPMPGWAFWVGPAAAVTVGTVAGLGVGVKEARQANREARRLRVQKPGLRVYERGEAEVARFEKRQRGGKLRAVDLVRLRLHTNATTGSQPAAASE
jgi:hypothetical protein